MCENSDCRIYACEGCDLVRDSSKSALNNLVMPGCVCEGNWRQIITETEPLLDSMYKNASDGSMHRLIGVMHCKNDYYYVMAGMDGKQKLLSCVGSIESFGYERAEA